jgi:hypothetical protein
MEEYRRLKVIYDLMDDGYNAAMGCEAAATVLRERLVAGVQRLALASFDQNSLEVNLEKLLKARNAFHEWGPDYALTAEDLDKLSFDPSCFADFRKVFTEAAHRNPDDTLIHLVFSMASVRKVGETLNTLFWVFLWLHQCKSSPPSDSSSEHNTRKRSSSHLSTSSSAPLDKKGKSREPMDVESPRELAKDDNISPSDLFISVSIHFSQPSALARKALEFIAKGMAYHLVKENDGSYTFTTLSCLWSFSEVQYERLVRESWSHLVVAIYPPGSEVPPTIMNLTLDGDWFKPSSSSKKGLGKLGTTLTSMRENKVIIFFFFFFFF